METFAFVQDLPIPVSRGSYRYKTGTVSPTARNKGFRVIYIKSGVKTPLLSDLERKTEKFRYGLDVVQRKSVPLKTPIAWTRNSPEYGQSVPPPTANSNKRRPTAATDKQAKKCIYMGSAQTSVDFEKLQPYSWNSTYDQSRLPPVAPDPLYRNSFNKEISEVHTPSPTFKPTRGLSLYGENSEQQRPHTVHGLHPTEQQLELPRVTFQRPETRQVQFSPEKSLVAKTDTSKLELDIRSFDQREKLHGPNGCLHAQLKHSIKFIKKVEKGELLQVPRLARPMTNERGRYRPHSRTIIPKTPPPVPEEEPLETEGEKDHKSAEVYLKFVKKKKIAKLMANENYNATPGMSEIIAKYMIPGGFTETPRTPTGTNNPPVSRCSTQLTNKVTIPEWAEEERKTTARIVAKDDINETSSEATHLSVNVPKTDENVTPKTRDSPVVRFSPGLNSKK